MVALTRAAPLTTIDGIILVALVVLFIIYLATPERGRETQAFRNAEVYEEPVEADARKRRCPPGGGTGPQRCARRSGCGT
jgi:hypothetical protein